MKNIILSVSILFCVWFSCSSQTPQPYIYQESGNIRLTVTAQSTTNDTSIITIFDRGIILDTSLVTHIIFNVKGVIRAVTQNKLSWNAYTETADPLIMYTNIKIKKIIITEGTTKPNPNGTGQDHTVMVRIE